ncbi:YggS family pyridoxal phosphate-dependent enzyme [Dehalococcoides mccartyi]|uniref:YggS family pyridoxal phosphate-dependent enzyme n=1 Tax=Dehalococcoides mccartyi TaxID=61435 RepID=UPI0003C80D41|nr:YggS family pyridoxal phosphate-dependent enzyme [Dehalococcoides mccartyi]AHB13424.1 alanine racemase domain-containing protein [Dehalococcoides mccartyi GY50]
MYENITRSVKDILAELPPDVVLEAAVKKRQPSEILAAIDAGIKIIGHNYLTEAEETYPLIGDKAEWHFIGKLQSNKCKKIVRRFSVVETVDSIEIASELNRRAAEIDKILSVFIEINSGREKQKSGVLPEETVELAKRISCLSNLKLTGLMTMGPALEAPEELRTIFRLTKIKFDEIAAMGLPNNELQFLSMGMSGSYKVAVQEGANLVRLGTRIFGPRP